MNMTPATPMTNQTNPSITPMRWATNMGHKAHHQALVCAGMPIQIRLSTSPAKSTVKARWLTTRSTGTDAAAAPGGAQTIQTMNSLDNEIQNLVNEVAVLN